MATRVRTMYEQILPAVLDGPIEALDTVRDLDDEVDELHGQIIEYLGRIGQKSLSAATTDELVDLMEATNNLEAIGDLIETNLVELGVSRLANQYRVGDESRAMIVEYHREVGRALDMAIEALVLGDADQARRVSDMKGDLDGMAQTIAEHYARRLAAPEDHRIQLYRFETDVVVNLKRVYYFAKRTARAAIPTTDQAAS